MFFLQTNIFVLAYHGWIYIDCHPDYVSLFWKTRMGAGRRPGADLENTTAEKDANGLTTTHVLVQGY